MRYKVIGVHPDDSYHSNSHLEKIKGRILSENEVRDLSKWDENSSDGLQGTYHGAVNIIRNKKHLDFHFYSLILKEMK